MLVHPKELHVVAFCNYKCLRVLLLSNIVFYFNFHHFNNVLYFYSNSALFYNSKPTHLKSKSIRSGVRVVVEPPQKLRNESLRTKSGRRTHRARRISLYLKKHRKKCHLSK